jgi:methylamine dehydrogenase light chain
VAGPLTLVRRARSPHQSPGSGTCHNRLDDRDYLISYADCCGKAICDRCHCHNTERERPVYDPGKSNSVLWCFGTESREYHCTISLVLGVADGKG